GLVTVPGYQQFNDALNWAGDGDGGLFDTLYQRFDRPTADLISTGILSNLPSMVGLPGVALYTRGDTAPRLPGFNAAPGINVIQTAAEAIGDGVDLFRKGNPDITDRQVAAVFGKFIQNRPINGMIQSFWTGGSVDERGNLVARETAASMTAIYRAMGFRPLQE